MHSKRDEAWAIPPWTPPALPIAGGGIFPVRRIFCVGRNYAAHAREMGHDPDREPPFFFAKPAEAVLRNGDQVPYPPATDNLQPEVELVVALAEGGRDIAPDQALDRVFGYAVGIDLTRRDLQAEAKRLGRPWDLAKGFDGAAPCGRLRAARKEDRLDSGSITLNVNGTPRQCGNLSQMIWSVEETIAYLSRFITLLPGDLLFTGTPKGVAPIQRGDRLEGRIEGLDPLIVTIS